MKKKKRSRYLVDPKVQVPLLVRMVLYGLAYLGAIASLVGLQVVLSNQDVSSSVLAARVAVSFGPALLASVVMLPLVLFDCVRFSNRFCGPMHRLRGQVAKLVDEGNAEKLTFRRDDFWYELAEQFNRLADKMERLEQSQTSVNDEACDAQPAGHA